MASKSITHPEEKDVNIRKYTFNPNDDLGTLHELIIKGVREHELGNDNPDNYGGTLPHNYNMLNDSLW